MEKYGHFEKNGYLITQRNTPRHWSNYLYNEEYITSVSQVGYGRSIAQDQQGYRLNVISDRAIYICDEERLWQANGLPIHKKLQHYQCEHHIGYTDITVNYRSIRSHCRFFVPTEGKREYLRVSLKNESHHTRTLKIMPYYALQHAEDVTDVKGVFLEDQNCVISCAHAHFDGAFAKQYTYLLSTDTVTGYDACQSAFIGPYGNKLQPAAIIENMGCTNSDCVGEKSCLVLENTITLLPGESKVFYYTVGVENSPEHIPQFLPAEIEDQLSSVISGYETSYKSLRIHSPWEDLNQLFNDWLKYETDLGAFWGKIDHNHFGVIAGNAQCLSCIDAVSASKKLCRILSYQHENGYAPRIFEDGKILDCYNSDSALWAVSAAHSVTKELGNVDFLLQKIPFNNGESATIYEHVKRALLYLWKSTGHFGLIKIQGGDWNEGIDSAGMEGKGVSVWLSIAFVSAARKLSEMANWIGSEADSKTGAFYAQEMEKRILQYGWDNDRYIYAISDDKKFIGAASCNDGALFAMPQIWSVLAKLDAEHCEIAMDTLEQQLNTDLGLVACAPPYSYSHSHIGSLTRQQPGVANNGSVHLQIAAWKLMADSLLSRNDKVEEGLRKILPDHQEYHQTFGEPYVLPEYYYATPTMDHMGQPGPSWKNATAPWLMYALVKYIYGLQTEFGGLLIKPCLPISWRECSISKTFRECQYNIHYVQKDNGPCNTIEAIYVNGIQVNTFLPIRPQPNKTLDIEVILRA